MGWEDGCFITLGLLFLVIGISIRLGKLKEYYWMQPLSYYRTGVYILIPLGMALLLLAAIPLFYGTVWLTLLRTLVIFLGLISVFIVVFQPKFVKPDWINRLEENYFDILPELRGELWQMGPERKEIIQNQAKLEVWIEEFRRRQAG